MSPHNPMAVSVLLHVRYSGFPSGIGETFARGIQNLGIFSRIFARGIPIRGLWNLSSSLNYQGSCKRLESGIHISVTRNSDFHCLDFGSDTDHSGESRILDCVGLPLMGLTDPDESGETKEGFLLNTLKTQFRISRVMVLSDL